MKKFLQLINLFFSFFKIGLLTFGGGYAMISVFEDEFCSKKQYITEPEFIEMIALAESTPGPIAINGATYVGYKRAGVLGSIFATIGMVLPSFIIIYLISIYFDAFMQIALVQKAFRGIQCGIGVLIINAGIKMLKKAKKDWFNITWLVLTIILMVVVELFSIKFSAIYVIVFGGALGVIRTLFDKKKELKGE